MRIRIFALAKELDMDSKILMDFCAKAGIHVKASALASISPDERDRVLELIRQAGPKAGGPAAAAPSATAPVAPTRDQQTDLASRVRTIRTMTARAIPSRPRPMDPPAPQTQLRSQDEDRSTAAVAYVEAAPPHATKPVEADVVADEAVAAVDEQSVVASEDTAIAAESATVADVAPSTGSEVQDEPGAEQDASATDDQPAADAPDRGDGGPKDGPGGAPTRPAPITRSDYVSPGSPTRSMRVMTARGTSETSPPRQQPQKPRPKVAAPIVAAIPNFKPATPQKPKPEEQKAQKPEFRFSQEALAQRGSSPLQDHLRKSQDVKKRRADEEPTDDARKNRAIPGERVAQDDNRLRRDRRRGDASREDEGDGGGHKQKFRFRGKKNVRAELKTSAEIELPITVRSLSEALGRPAKQIIKILWDQQKMVTVNESLEEEEALEIAMEMGVELHIQRPKDVEDELQALIDLEDDPENLVARPPIVTILGHVDHGKTTLVDKLRSSNVAAGEHGGITQHIAAYQVDRNGQKLTFVDTPGHAAFGEMRARGANVTDIVVLVVAANDGVMPQTVECISHARAANVPIVVALNKVDLPERNEQRILQDLAAHDVLAAEWGGDVEVVRTSGLTGAGLDSLLDTLLLTAELHELKANPDRLAVGTCMESFRDEGRGPVAWMMVQTGTLQVGDVILCGESFGKVRALFNDRDEEVEIAGPSTPIRVAGLDQVPNAGDRFVVLDDLDLAREIAEQRRERGRAASLAARTSRRTLEDVLNAARDGQVRELCLVVKADTPGSLEALRSEIGKFEHPEVRVKVLHGGVGGVNESDVYLAAASEAVIVAFHVIPDDRAEQLAINEGVDVRRYNIIYEVLDDIRDTLEGLLKPEQREVVTGRAIVLQTFSISRIGTIAGCRVLNGTIERSNRVHLIRDQKIINRYSIASLRREKDDVRDVREGMECGIRLDGFNDVKEGDLLEAFRIDEIRRTLEATSGK